MYFVKKIIKLLASEQPTFGHVMSINKNSINVATVLGLKIFPPQSVKIAVNDSVKIVGDKIYPVTASMPTIWLP